MALAQKLTLQFTLKIASSRKATIARDETVSRLHEIAAGIEQTESDDKSGWCEYSPGDEFGTRKLAELEALTNELT